MTNIETVLAGAMVGAGYGALGYKTKSAKDEKFNFKKFARTMFLFTVAGAIAGQNASLQEIEQVVGQVGILGVLFDMVYGKIKREYVEESG